MLHTENQMVNRGKVSVADYFAQQVAVCGISQKEIAKIAKLPNPNIISMLKSGATHVPLAKVGGLAKALSVDPMVLLRLVMSEYTPDTWAVVESIIGAQRMVGDQELALIELARSAARGQALDVKDAENRRELTEVFKRVAGRDAAKAKASVDRMESLPTNARHK